MWVRVRGRWKLKGQPLELSTSLLLSLSPSHCIGEENAWSLDSQYRFLYSESTQPATAVHWQLEKWMQYWFDSITLWKRKRKRNAVWICYPFQELSNGLPSICYNHDTCFTSSSSELRCFLTLVIIHSFRLLSKIIYIRQLWLRTDYIHVSPRSEILYSILSLLRKLNQLTQFQSVSNKIYVQHGMKKCLIYNTFQFPFWKMVLW